MCERICGYAGVCAGIYVDVGRDVYAGVHVNADVDMVVSMYVCVRGAAVMYMKTYRYADGGAFGDANVEVNAGVNANTDGDESTRVWIYILR